MKGCLLLIRWLAALAWTLFTLLLMWTPDVPVPRTFLGDLTDKAGHMALFCVLTLSWSWVLMAYMNRHQVFRAALIGVILFGACTELGQYFVPGRDVNFFDFSANALGVAIGATLMYWAKTRRAMA